MNQSCPWVRINSDAILNPDLHASDRKVLLTLEMKAGASRTAKYQIRDLVDLTGLNRATVFRALKHLQKFGFLKARDKDWGRKQLRFRLAPQRTPFAKSWRCIWYSHWDYWMKDVFLTISAAYRADGGRFVVFRGREFHGLIDLCHLRNYTETGQNQEASTILHRFLNELESGGLIQVTQQANRKKALSIEINEQKLLEITAARGDDWREWEREWLRQSRTVADGKSRTVADGKSRTVADGKSRTVADGKSRTVADAEEIQGKSSLAAASKRGTSCPHPPGGPAEPGSNSSAIRRLLEAVKSLRGYEPSRDQAHEPVIAAAFLDFLDPRWEPQDLVAAWNSKELRGWRTFCWQFIENNSKNLRQRFVAAINRNVTVRTRSVEEQLLESTLLRNTRLHLSLNSAEEGDRLGRRTAVLFLSALAKVLPELTYSDLGNGWVEVYHGRLSEQQQDLIRADFRKQLVEIQA